MVAQFAPGLEIPLHPFFGSMGVAPPRDSGRVSSNPPSIHAGNLDNKELVAGTTLFIPIHTPAALFEVGDAHAAQGDRPVDQTALAPSPPGRLPLLVRNDMPLPPPPTQTTPRVAHEMTTHRACSPLYASRKASLGQTGNEMDARRALPASHPSCVPAPEAGVASPGAHAAR